MNEKLKYPCTSCKRYPDYRMCIEKNCGRWQKWFIFAWDEARQKVREKYGRQNYRK